MDPVDVCTASSTGDKKRRVNKKNSVWQKRLHLRKTAVRPPAMQSQDKQHGPKKIAEEWERSTAWPSSKKKPPQETRQSRRRTSDRNTLRFTCSQCKDGVEYLPRDLVSHFEEKHRGSPPVFSCHTCTFSTPEFSYFQVHLLSHKDTFSGCSICNDGVQRTWPEFSSHLTMCHCLNGKYSCEMCPKFSTGDVRGFLEHIYVHNLEGTNDLPLHIKGDNQLGPKTTTQTCQHCGYEASQKWLITRHIKAVHVCQNGSQRKKTATEAHSIAVKPNDTIPKIKSRLTRSAVREMCWLTQDCLSLPGREFLDKYCHLSDPQTTLEETQQFLMKSVETGDQKWTNALKTVLSNVPQDMNLHPKSENGLMSNSSDLTVLTVKNKITVAQNGATYAKRLKMMTSSDKDAVSPQSADDDPQCAVDLNGCPSDLIDRTPEHKLHSDVLQNEPSERAHTQENRENQEVKTEQEMEGPVHSDGIHVFSDLKLATEGEEQTTVHKAQPKKRRKTRRWKRKTRFKKVVKTSPGLVLKLVLKKNPVKEKQWVSQSPLSEEIDGQHGAPSPQTATEEEAVLQNLQPTEEDQKKQTKTDPSEAISSPQRSNPGEEFSTKNMMESTVLMLEDRPSIDKEVQEDAENSEVDKSRSAGRTSRTISRAPSVTDVEMSPENARTPHNDTKCHESGDGLAINGAATPLSQPAVISQDQISVRDPCSVVSAEQSVGGVADREVPADSCSDLVSSVHVPAGKAIQHQAPPASGRRWQPAPKTLVRSLKLVAINPCQLVKRPAGNQPVVVLNHPDADIPEVARIMEVVNRYREVQRVVLSRRTLRALKGLEPDTDAQTQNSVQERFTLKLKFRRLSRKKYEIVGAESPGRDAEEKKKKFCCWFCGRLFACRQTWMTHRQRHLMDWNGTNCEKNS
ncbi:uncharacterized protein znf518a [Parambassis ranga]|uniref:Uncharacterized protein znf518a n=1 Tax=Parambassis ranga TaxID=210632 RepID=A0A6P7JPE4_9TELE|nr:uncharacterized protein LOC114447060 [Parambassis ranga]